MSQGWSRPQDVELVCESGRRFDVSIPLREFARLREPLASDSGEAAVSVHFTAERGLAIAEVAVAAVLELTCQRCLQAMQWPVDSRSRLALVADLAAADAVPDGVDPVVIEGGRTSVLELAEEELLLALPLVAMHEDEAQCGGASADATPDEQPEETHTPFAQLGELLKRDR